jgi:hypothetical protein
MNLFAPRCRVTLAIRWLWPVVPLNRTAPCSLSVTSAGHLFGPEE